MTKTQTYKVTADDQQVVATVTAATPAKALRAACGDELAEQCGRYGTLKDGRHVAALLVHGGRRYLGGHEWGR